MIESIFDFPIYCINLEKDVDRKKFINMQLKDKNIKFIDAVYGKCMKENKIKCMQEISQKNPNQKLVMDVGELGCLMSHIKIYIEALTNSKSEYILVIEDDVNFITYYNKNIDKFIVNNLHNYDCIQLCVIVSKLFMEIDDINKNNNIILDWNEYDKKCNGWGCFWSTGCYLISRESMKKLLNVYLMSDKLLPSDYFIYNNLKTGVLIPPIFYPCDMFESNIINNLDWHIVSSNYLTNKYYSNNYLILISIWFGNLPDCFNLWLFSLKNKKYDILFITDQTIKHCPDNIKVINMNLNELNELISRKFNFNIEIKSNAKIVDLKPALGYLFYELIYNYEYWGWTDIDMIMGNLINKLEENKQYDIFSFGFETFGPMMIFKKEKIDIYKSIENYEEILNDHFICKVDEPWFFINSGFNQDKTIYIDQNKYVKYYKGNNLINYVLDNNVKIFGWDEICVNIDWQIKNKVKNNYSNKCVYKIGDNLIKNNREICFCHLTLLKTKNVIVNDINNKINDCNFDDIKNISLEIYHNKFLSFNKKHLALDNLNIYEVYDKFIETTYKFTIMK